MATVSKQPDDRGLTLAYWQRDLPASIVVFLGRLPLCMGVALASGRRSRQGWSQASLVV